MAGDVIGDLAERGFEVGAQKPILLAQHEVLERIEHRVAHGDRVRILRVHERDLLLEHQRAGGHRRENRVALRRVFREHRDVLLLELIDAFDIAELELRHAAASLFLHQHVRDLVVLEQRDQVMAHHRLVVVGIAGGEDRDLARRVLAVAHRECLCLGRRRSELARRIRRQLAVLVHAEHRLHRRARRFQSIHAVNSLSDNRDRRELAERIGGGEQPIAELNPFAKLDCLRAQHHVGEVDVPRMRRHVGALRHVAEIAEVALVDHLPVVLFRHAVDLHGLGAVDEIEQRGKRGAQVHASAAAVADLEDAPELALGLRLVPELRRLPSERVPRRRFERAFPHC